MKEISDKEYEFFQKLRKVFMHTQPEKLENVYFVCGDGGPRDSMGLPRIVLICPAHGLDGFAIYTKTQDYSAPGY